MLTLFTHLGLTGKLTTHDDGDCLTVLPLSRQALVTAEQVHGNRLVWVGASDAGKRMPAVDGLLTSARGVGLGMRVADCVPIYIWHETVAIYGLVHAGWKGIAAGIETSLTLELAQHYPLSSYHFYLGPAIGACCFTLGAEAYRQLVGAEQANASQTVDLRLLLNNQLVSLGVPAVNIQCDERCTCCDKQFYSYRRDHTPFRMLATCVMS